MGFELFFCRTLKRDRLGKEKEGKERLRRQDEGSRNGHTLKALSRKVLNGGCPSCSGRFYLQQKEDASALCILDILALPTADFLTNYGF